MGYTSPSPRAEGTLIKHSGASLYYCVAVWMLLAMMKTKLYIVKSLAASCPSLRGGGVGP